MLKETAEGYIMRFGILGIRDAVEADAAIRKMDSLKWSQLLYAWWAKNPSRPRTPAAAKTSRTLPALGVTETRAVALRFHIDTNRINSRGKLSAMNRLEQWHGRGVIEILMPEPAADEAMRGGDDRRCRKARSYVHGLTALTTVDERRMLQRNRQIIFPNGLRDDPATGGTSRWYSPRRSTAAT